MIQTTVIEAIKSKIDTITADNSRLRSEMLSLIAERDLLVAQKRELTMKVDEQSRRIDILEMSEAVGGAAGDTKKAKLKVNRLLREIDKCIVLMNK